MLITISGPSGSGKTTLSNNIKQIIGAKEVPSFTTRKPRSSDTKNTYYHFITTNEFKDMQKQHHFIITDEFSGNMYGTLKNDIIKATQDNEQIWIADLTCYSVIDLINIGYTPHFAFFLYIPRLISKQRMKQRGDSNYTQKNKLETYYDTMESSIKLATQFPNLKFICANRDKQLIITDIINLIKGH